MILLASYLGALIVGGGLLAASALLGGHHGHDHEHELQVGHDHAHELGHDHDHDAGHDAGADHDGHISAGEALWLPILSIRFWTFFLAFFGLTGTLLEGMRRVGWVGAHPGIVAGLAAVVGVAAGYAIQTILRRLKQERISSDVVPETDYAGKAGEVLLDVAPGDPGMVRLDCKGVSIDLSAVAADGDTPRLSRGSKVIVLAYKDGKVVVAPFETGEADAVAERKKEPA